MNWSVEFLPEAQKDFDALAGNQRLLVAKAIKKVQQNPVSTYEGGYGKPLGSKGGTDLSGLFKIKLKAAGLRIVYKLIRIETEMLIVVIGARADDEVYQIAEKRVRKTALTQKETARAASFFALFTYFFFGNTKGSCR